MSGAADPSLLDPRQRRRAYSAVFAGVALSTTGYLAAVTVNGLIAEDLTGSAAWSGIPGAAGVLGSALGAVALANLVRRVGPRTGLTLGYAVATLSAGLSVYAILSHHFILFVASLFVFGIGFGANRLARYAAADLYPPEQRGTMIGWIVWASTIGAVAGPALLAPSRVLAEWIPADAVVGPYLVCLAATALSAIVMLVAPRRMDARPLIVGPVSDEPAATLASLLSDARVMFALVSMVSGQFVMVFLMTMTPVHLRHEHHGLGAIGLVISAHTLGMFALSPITGRLADRFGRVPMLMAGVFVLVLACVCGAWASMTSSYPQMVVALFLLGVGWNLGFVAGSALLTDSVPARDRTRIQGFGDSLIWSGGAIASIASGWMLERTGFVALALIGLFLSLAPLVPWWQIRGRAAVRA